MAFFVTSFDARSAIAGLNTCVNTFHILSPGPPTTAETNSLLAPFKTFYDTLGAYRNTVSTVQIGTRVLQFDTTWWVPPVFNPDHSLATPGHFTTPPTIVGATVLSSPFGSGGTPIPPQLASVLSWRTAVSGRSGRGRTYLGVLGSAAQTQNVVTGGFVTAANTAAATLITAVSGVSAGGGFGGLCIWSPTKGQARIVLSGAMDGTFDTMRSRVK